jgi:hypothetical protein
MAIILNIKQNMKQITSIEELLNVISDGKTIFQDVNGKKYEFLLVRLLQTQLGHLMSMVKDGLLFYENK